MSSMSSCLPSETLGIIHPPRTRVPAQPLLLYRGQKDRARCGLATNLILCILHTIH